MTKILPDVGPRYVMKRIKSDAKPVGREFSLTLEQVKKMIHEPCHYCGSVNQNRLTVKSKTPGKYLIKDFCYNGLDRVDNSVGYRIDNVVPCCAICNRAKNNLGKDEFLAWIERLMVYRNDLRVPVQGRDSKSGENPEIQEPVR